MDVNFFRETYPIVFLYGLFLLSIIWNFMAWIIVDPRGDEHAKYLRAPRGGFFLYAWLEFTVNLNWIYRFFVFIVFGCMPVYFMMHHGYEKYEKSLYMLLGFYLIWILEKLTRTIISKEVKET